MGRVDQSLLRALLLPLAEPGQALVLPPGTTDDTALATARHHRLSPALSLVRAPAISEMLLDSLRQDRLVTLGRGALLRRALAELVRALHAGGVKTIVLKGIGYEELLRLTPGTRPATDIDLLVPRDQRGASFAVFRALGFRPSGGGPGFDEPAYHELMLRRGDLTVDLHFGLAPFVRCAIDYQGLWAQSMALPIDGAPAFGLSRPHAAVHQALHMAIHHFDVPAMALLDLARLVSDPGVGEAAMKEARLWRCWRPWQTAVSLTAAFIPGAAARLAPAGRLLPSSPRAERVVRSYGGLIELPRVEQLRRKLEHFDTALDASRYLAVQGRRVIREKLLTLWSARSPADRLGWG